ncbi:MAG: hypothetical protein QOG75_1937 [Mycobacterium sp.]|jgi:adenylosuccinate synthase|nr:hypothetical protein [Mycobacterium sp.]
MALLGRNLERAAARPGLSILAGDDHYALPSGTLANPDALLLIGPGATLDLDVLNDEMATNLRRHRVRDSSDENGVLDHG